MSFFVLLFYSAETMCIFSCNKKDVQLDSVYSTVTLVAVTPEHLLKNWGLMNKNLTARLQSQVDDYILCARL